MPQVFDFWLAGQLAGEVAMASAATPGALAASRGRRLQALLKGAFRHSAFYRRLYNGLDLDRVALAELPVTSKRELMGHFADWVTDPALRLADLRRLTADRSRIAEPYLGRYVVWESSGSSGEPGIFVQDAHAMAVYDALEALRRPSPRPLARLLDPWMWSERIAFVGATGGHFASAVSAARLRRLNPALAANLHDVSFLQPTARLVAELNALAPSVIATYPSAALLLAQERAAGRLRVDLNELWTGGETLTGAVRRGVEQAFGCPVLNSYGASEFLALASQCRCGSLHLNADWAIVESVDDRGRPVPAGEPGATSLLTNLANRVQPLIRYDLGDRVRLLDPACACGSGLPVIEVEGRSDDTLMLAVRGAPPVHVLPLALSTVLEDEAGLFDFQLDQLGGAELCLATPRHGAGAQAALRRARVVLQAFLARQGAPDVQIHCHAGRPNQRGPGGKVQRVRALRPGPAPGLRKRNGRAGAAG